MVRMEFKVFDRDGNDVTKERNWYSDLIWRNCMKGILGSISILIGTLVVFYVIYKRETGRNLIKDVLDDISYLIKRWYYEQFI